MEILKLSCFNSVCLLNYRYNVMYKVGLQLTIIFIVN